MPSDNPPTLPSRACATQSILAVCAEIESPDRGIFPLTKYHDKDHVLKVISHRTPSGGQVGCDLVVLECGIALLIDTLKRTVTGNSSDGPIVRSYGDPYDLRGYWRQRA